MQGHRFVVRLKVRHELKLFEDEHATRIFRGNLSFVSSKFGLKLLEARFASDQFEGTFEGPDTRTVAKAVERLQRFFEKEILQERADLGERLLGSREGNASIWQSPASCRRLP